MTKSHKKSPKFRNTLPGRGLFFCCNEPIRVFITLIDTLLSGTVQLQGFGHLGRVTSAPTLAGNRINREPCDI